MSIKRIFIVISAIFAASAVFADNSSVTSKKYVDDLMSGYQGKLPGSGANKLMIYDDEAGIGEKAIAATLGNSASAVSVPTVGAVKTGLDGKQDTITGTAGYVMTGTGTPGEVGERAIYSSTNNYSDAFVTAETVNTGVINAVNSSLIRVDENGAPSDSGTLWEINTDLLALDVRGYLPDGYTKLEYIESTGTQYIDTGVGNSDIDEYYVKFNTPYRTYGFIFGNFVDEQTECTRLLFRNANDGGMFSNVGNPAGKPNTSLGYIANGWNEAWGGKSGGFQYFKLNNYSKVFRNIESGNANTSNIALFANRIGGAFYPGKIASVRFKLNGALVRDFIPAKRDSDSKIGMYDIVNDVFYPDARAGNFTAGPSCISPNLYGGKYYKILVVSSTAYSPVEIQGDTWTADGVRRGIAKIIPVSGNTTYTFSVAGTQNVAQRVVTEYASIEDMSAATNAIATQGGAVGNLTFTTNANTKYLLVGVWAYPTPSAGTVVSITDPQLEKGSTATSYRPYGENICN